MSESGTIVSEFGFAPRDATIWEECEIEGLLARDLSLTAASGSMISGRRIKTRGGPVETARLIVPASGFVFLFVLSGKVRLTSGPDEIALGNYDCAVRSGAGKVATLWFSHDAELVLLQGSDADPANFGQDRGGGWSVNFDDEDAYLIGDGPRSYFKYRDLGVAAATGRRIHIHVVRATGVAGAGGTGWHWHSMGQLFMVLRGWANLRVENKPFVKVMAGDAMCLPPHMRHDVPDYSNDYLVLEMCIPADYETYTIEGDPFRDGSAGEI